MNRDARTEGVRECAVVREEGQINAGIPGFRLILHSFIHRPYHHGVTQ